MDYRADSSETSETKEPSATTERLGPGGIAAMQGDLQPAQPPLEAPPAEPPKPADQLPAQPEVQPPAPPVEPTQPPAIGERGMVDRIEKRDIGERDYYPSVSGERGG